MKVSDIVQSMEAWAPSRYAEDWDNVGLQVGDPAASVERVFLALTPTMDVIERARAQGCELILTHHPLIFKPLKRLTTADSPMREVRYLIEQGMSLLVAHTNLDAAAGGVNDVLADMLALKDRRPLEALPENTYKLVVFVPMTHVASLKEALFAAGAGRQGEYERCHWLSTGQGGFRPTAEAHPYLGTSGKDEKVEEARLEVLVSGRHLAAVLAALHRAHPYEEPAYDVFREERMAEVGIGRIGDLPAPCPLSQVLGQLGEALGLSRLPYVGEPDRLILRVALVGGAGSGYMERAAQLGADLYLTGDLTYHHYQRAREIGLAMADIRHFAGERPVLRAVRERLLADHPSLEITIDDAETNTISNEWRIV